MKQLKFFVMLAMCVSLLACAAKTKVLMDASLPPGEIMQGKIQKVFLELTEKAKKKLPSEKYFAPKTLHVVVANTLNRNQMISKEGKYNIKVLVDDIRTRSAVAAIMFGSLAGNDHIYGRVIVMEADTGKKIKEFEVDAAYALGGVAGGQTQSRMGWLYNKFADLVVKELKK